MISTNQNNTTNASLLQNRLLSDAITASELRIGNILSVGLYSVKVVEIQDKGVHVCDLEETQDTWELFDDRIKGQSLSDILMSSLGFKKTTMGGWMIDCGQNRLVIWSDKQISLDKNGNTIWVGYDLKIHQIQNLFFALSGKELEINVGIR